MTLRTCYKILISSNDIKIDVIIYNQNIETRKIINELKKELAYLWNMNDDILILENHDSIQCKWHIIENNLYENYLYQEKHISNIRSIHIKVMKSIKNGIKVVKNINSVEFSKILEQ